MCSSNPEMSAVREELTKTSTFSYVARLSEGGPQNGTSSSDEGLRLKACLELLKSHVTQ